MLVAAILGVVVTAEWRWLRDLGHDSRCEMVLVNVEEVARRCGADERLVKGGCE